MTAGQRGEWDTWALTDPGKGDNDGGINNMIKGNSGDLSGFNAFVMAQMWLYSAGLGGVADAPLADVAPSAPTGVGVAFAAGTATVTWTTPNNATVGAICRIFGRVEGIKGHVQLITTEAYDTDTKDIIAIRGADGQSILFTSLVGKIFHVQMDTVNPEGTKSAGSNSIGAVIA